jgi:hypothetical protein
MRIFDVSRSGYTPRIRIINLVDILFILLLFFIATTTFRIATKEPSQSNCRCGGKRRQSRQAEKRTNCASPSR